MDTDLRLTAESSSTHDPLTLQVSTVLTTACFGVAAVYFVMHIAAIAFPPPWNQNVLNITGLLWASICFVLGVYVLRRELTGETPHLVLCLLAVGMTLHATLVLHFLDSPIHSLNLVLIAISAGYFFAKRFWFYSSAALITAAWLSAFAVSNHDNGDWRIWGGTLVVGMALSITLFEARRRAALKIHTLNLQAVHARERQSQMERVIQEAQRRESLGVLAGGIAHDFNNLLTIILGNTELALSRVQADAKTVALLSDVTKASSRAADLTQLMLVYAGRSHPNVSEFDFGERIQSNIALVESSLPRGVSLVGKSEIDDLRLKADKTLVDQILLNLYQNAVDACVPDGGTIVVTWGVETLSQENIDPGDYVVGPEAGNYAFVDVSDTGAGMSADIQAHMFEPFFSTKFDGTGLGLAAIRGIVESHNGALKVDSDINVGTSVRVLLPLSEKLLADVQSIALFEVNTDHADYPPANATVMIVDDHPDVRATAERMLSEVGYQVLVADSGKKALELIDRSAAIDLAIVDLTMPHEDGLQVIRQLLEKQPTLKVALMSGFDLTEVLASGSDAPSNLAYIEKPFTKKQLADTAKNLLLDSWHLGKS